MSAIQHAPTTLLLMFMRDIVVELESRKGCDDRCPWCGYGPEDAAETRDHACEWWDWLLVSEVQIGRWMNVVFGRNDWT